MSTSSFTPKSGNGKAESIPRLFGKLVRYMWDDHKVIALYGIGAIVFFLVVLPLIIPYSPTGKSPSSDSPAAKTPSSVLGVPSEEEKARIAMEEKAREEEKARIAMEEKAREEEKARIAMEEKARIAIREVLDQRKLVDQDIAPRADSSKSIWTGDTDLMMEYANRLDAIVVSSCPIDFQIAYKKFVAAEREKASWASSNYGIPMIAKGIMTAGIATIADHSKWEELKKNCRTAFLAMEESAIRHGVTP